MAVGFLTQEDAEAINQQMEMFAGRLATMEKKIQDLDHNFQELVKEIKEKMMS